MSTQIQNTLFRFVSLRSPELPEKETKEVKFVFRPQAAEGSHFDNAVASIIDGQSIWEKLEVAATSFTNKVNSVESLSTNVSVTFYDFSTWLIKIEHL